MEKVISAVSRCSLTYSRLRHLKSLQRCSLSTSGRCLGRFEPDGLKLEPDIPEYPTLNLRLQGYDYAILGNFAKHVHQLSQWFSLESDSWPAPAFKQSVNILKPRSKMVAETLVLNTFERVIQIDAVPSVKLPVFLEFVRNNCPQGVTVTLKEATEADEEFRYIPELEKIELKEQLAELGGTDKKKATQ